MYSTASIRKKNQNQEGDVAGRVISTIGEHVEAGEYQGIGEGGKLLYDAIDLLFSQIAAQMASTLLEGRMCHLASNFIGHLADLFQGWK